MVFGQDALLLKLTFDDELYPIKTQRKCTASSLDAMGLLLTILQLLRNIVLLHQIVVLHPKWLFETIPPHDISCAPEAACAVNIKKILWLDTAT
jgi:hypothetical protein